MNRLYRYLVLMLAFTVILSACAPAIITPTPLPSPTPTNSPTPTATPLPTAIPGKVVHCTLPSIIAPTPAPTPGFAELDPSTGMHYTGNAKVIDLATYRLEVSGMVDYPLKLSLDDLRCMPKIEVKTTIVCKGNFEDTDTWAGVPMKYVLELAGIQPQAKNVRMVGADEYTPFITREDAMADTAFLAYEWEKQPVPIIHGFHVRVALTGLLGANWV